MRNNLTINDDKSATTNLLADLVRINSINPSLQPGAPGETEITAYIADFLNDLNLNVTTHEVEAGRINVVGRLAGSGGGRSLMLNGHTDTVGVDGMTIEPFSADIREGKMYGRGTYDMKGSLAAMLSAVKTLVDAGAELAGDVLLTLVVDEEFSSIGTIDIVKHYHADGAIVTEPTDMAICRAHRGYIWYEVETIGRAAHGSRYDLGIDANLRMGGFLYELDQLEKELRTRPPHPLAGPPSLHAAMINGGTEPSIYAASCKLQVERRTIAGETETAVTQELQAIIDRLAAADSTFRATLKPVYQREPFEISADAPIVTALEDAVTRRLVQKPDHIGQPFWTDAAFLSSAGMETVLIGPTGQGLHAAEEWVDIQSVVDLAHILAETAMAYCSG